MKCILMQIWGTLRKLLDNKLLLETAYIVKIHSTPPHPISS